LKISRGSSNVYGLAERDRIIQPALAIGVCRFRDLLEAHDLGQQLLD
jgi:hypothetical protein